MAPRQPFSARLTGNRDDPINLTLLSDEEVAPTPVPAPRARPQSKPQSGPAIDLTRDDYLEQASHMRQLTKDPFRPLGRQSVQPAHRRIQDVVDLTGASPEPDIGSKMRDAGKIAQGSSPRRRNGAGESSRNSTPKKTKDSRKSSTPSRRAGHETSSSKATIEDSDVLMQDTWGEFSPSDSKKLPTKGNASDILFNPLPDDTFETPPEQQGVTMAFTDWTPPQIPLEYDKIRAAWERNVDEFREDHARYAADQLERARMHNQKAERARVAAYEEAYEETISTQTDPKWYDAPAVDGPATAGGKTASTFTFTLRACHRTATPTKMYVNMTAFRPKAINIPHFRTYYPIRRSQLVQSERDLLVWPEATEKDDYSEDDIEDELKGQFHFRMVTRPPEVAYVQIGRQWQPYAEAFLQDLNLSEEDMLRFVLDSSFDEHVRAALTEIEFYKGEMEPLDLLKQIRRELVQAPQSKAIRERMVALAKEEEGFDDLKKLKFQYLALAFYAVSSYYRYLENHPSFNFMYCLTQSPTLNIAKFLADPQEDAEEKPKYSVATHFDLACRICHVYPCFVHGLDSMWDYQPPDPPEEDDDEGDEPSVENALCPLFDTLTSLHRQRLGRRPVQAPKVPQESKPEKDIEFADYSLYGDPNAKSKVKVFFPCNHAGPCEVGTCHCADSGEGGQHHHCEKTCGCDQSCRLRFKGCRCARKGKICSEESKCACLKAGRECDPDLCGICGVYEVLDPQNCNQDAPFFKDKCHNCQIQRNVPKRTLIGESTTHGVGLFTGEDIKKGEYIGEYLGAKLNWKQAERGGLYLLFNGYSYLFDMTGDQTVDAMVMGNKQRFINSIVGKWNCAPKVLMCNTEHRMGLYATKDIPAGEELSFNYGETFFHNHSVQAKRKAEKDKVKAVGVKQYKRGPYKKRAKADKTKAQAVQKNVAAVRTKSSALKMRKMVEALQKDTPETEIEHRVRPAIERMDIDSEEDDEMDDDSFEDEESEVIDDSSEETDSDNDAASSRRILAARPRGGRRK